MPENHSLNDTTFNINTMTTEMAFIQTVEYACVSEKSEYLSKYIIYFRVGPMPSSDSSKGKNQQKMTDLQVILNVERYIATDHEHECNKFN